MDPADYAIHQCVFECVLELPTSCLTQVMDLFASGISILVLLIVSISGLGDSIQAQPCAASMAWKLGIARTMAVFFGWKMMMNHDEPWWTIKFLASLFSEKPISVCFWMDRKMKKQQQIKDESPPKLRFLPDETCFFLVQISSGFEAPAWERTTITRDCADLWLHRGLFRLDLLLGTLGTATKTNSMMGHPLLKPGNGSWMHTATKSWFSAASVFCWFTEGIVAAQPRETIDACPLLFARQVRQSRGLRNLAQPNLLKEFTIRRFNMQPKAWRSDIGKTSISSQVSTGFHVQKHDLWYDLIWFVMINHDFPMNAPNYAYQSLPGSSRNQENHIKSSK